MANYDILGNIAIIKFQNKETKKEKLSKAKQLLQQYKTVKAVLEKANKVSGRLRTIKTKHLLGEKTLEADYLENGCRFKFNVETCYFSPRLANERLEIAKLINREIEKRKLKNASVLVIFSGIGPFSIVISKHSKANKIVSIELGKECCKYASKNAIINKAWNLEIIQGDVKKQIKNLKERFDFIVMPRPNLKETFLVQAFAVSKKSTKIIYYGFCSEKNLEKMLDQLHKEAKQEKKKIKITNIKQAGDIAPYEHRYRIEIELAK